MVYTGRSRNAAFLAVAYKLIFLPWARREVMSEHFAATTFDAFYNYHWLDFLHPADFASISEQNHFSPTASLILVDL